MKTADPEDNRWLVMIALLGILFIFIGPKYLPPPWFQITAFLFITLCLMLLRRPGGRNGGNRSNSGGDDGG